MTTALTTYSATEAVLADLRDRFANVAWDVSTTVGMANAKEARAEINGWLTGLEKERKAQKSEHLKAGKRIDSEAKDIAAELLTLKEPPDKAIKEVEQRKKREEAEKAQLEEERVAKCREEIDIIRAVPLSAVGSNAARLQEVIEDLEGHDHTSLAEFVGVADSARKETLNKLREMRAEAKGREEAAAKLETERAELEKLRAEQEERDAAEKVKREAEEKERAEVEAQARTGREAEDRERREKLESDEEEGRRRRAEHENRILEEDRIAREAREKADAEARKLRAAQEADARKAREAEEERQRTERERLKAEREKAYAEEMGAQRQRDMLLDGRAMLVIFIERFGDVEEFATVAGQIKGYLAASKA